MNKVTSVLKENIEINDNENLEIDKNENETSIEINDE